MTNEPTATATPIDHTPHDPTPPDGPTALEQHAERELRAAGLFDSDSDYDGAIGPAVMELMRALCGKGHSGGSASIVLGAFDRVARWQNLMPITSNPDEWTDVANVVADQKPATLWQSKRNPALFSVDGGKHYYSVDERASERTPGTVIMMVGGAPRVMHEAHDPSKPYVEPPSAWVQIVEMCERWATDHPIDQLVLEDMRARRDGGRIVIGTSDPIVSCYEHQLDVIGDLATVIIAQGLQMDTMNTRLGELLWRTISGASTVREMMMMKLDGSKPFNVAKDDGLPST